MGLIVDQSFIFALLKYIWFVLINFITKFFYFKHSLRFPIGKLSIYVWIIIIFNIIVKTLILLFKLLNFVGNILSIFIREFYVLWYSNEFIPKNYWVYLSITNPALFIIYFMLCFYLPLSGARYIVFVTYFSWKNKC